MALYSAHICFDVSYHADDDEITTHDHAMGLAEMMRLTLQRSPRINAVAINVGEIESVEQEHE